MSETNPVSPENQNQQPKRIYSPEDIVCLKQISNPELGMRDDFVIELAKELGLKSRIKSEIAVEAKEIIEDLEGGN